MKIKIQSNQEISTRPSLTHQVVEAFKEEIPNQKKAKAILMYISNNSGMATLLQQKNCIKTLTNGGGVGVGVGVSNTTNSNLSSSSGGSVIVANHGSSTGLNVNGANNTIVTHHHNHHNHHILHNNHHSTTTTTQQTRMLRPHEMVSIPIGSIVAAASSGTNSGLDGATQGAFLVTGYQTSHYNNNNNYPHIQNATLTDLTVITHNTQQQNNKSNTTMYSHSNFNASATTTANANANANANGNATTTASGITTQTRYFSQFSNNHQQHQQPHHPHQQHELNNILYQVSTTSAGTNTVNRIVPIRSHHLNSSLPATTTTTAAAVVAANSNSNATYTTIVKQELQPMNSSSSSSNQQLPPHLQINQTQIKTEPPFDDQRINGDNETFVSNGNLSTTTTTTTTTTLPNGNAVAENATEAADGVETPTAAAAADEVEAEPEPEPEPEPEIDIVINNVVCSFSVRCHLNLREIALQGFNVEFRRENGMVTMKLRRPYTTASIWSSGRITCTGATSEDQAKIAARRYARCLQKLGFRVRFNNFRVVNVLGTCSMPFAIKIVNFSEKYKKEASYEPELHPGVTYKLRYPKATLKIFSTGSITVTAASVANVQAAIEHIFPLVYEFRKKRTPEELEILRLKQQHNNVELVDNESEETPDHSLPASKRKRRRPAAADIDDIEEDVDDPSANDANATDDIIMVSEFDDPDDLIEGPDDEDDDL